MTAQQDNAALVRDVHQAWNKRDFDRIIALTSPEVEWVMMPTGQKFRGLDGIRQYAQGWATAFPDERVEDSDLIAGHNGDAVGLTGRGTHQGHSRSPSRQVPPTRRRLQRSSCA